jgi:universal stress protein E
MHRFKNMLCVINSETVGVPALERAVALCARNQARLTVVEVIERRATDIALPTDEGLPGDLRAAVVKAHTQTLDRLVEPYRSRADVTTRVLIGVPFLSVIREVLLRQYDLVIKNPDSPDWLDRVFGSDDMHLLRKCPCPVWLLTPDAPAAYRRILAAVDVNDAYTPNELDSRRALNQQVLELAVSLAQSEGAELHVVHAWDAPGEGLLRRAWADVSEERVADYVEQVRRGREARMDALVQGVTGHPAQDTADAPRFRAHLVEGSAGREVPALARRIGADCLVMGTVGRTGVSGFFIGNTAETILDQVTCSVLALKPPGFVTPVRPEEDEVSRRSPPHT